MASPSPAFSSCADFTRESFNLARPAAIACCARLRVLKKRAAQSHLSIRSDDSCWTAHAGAAQPAVAARILGEVLLVIVLSVVELGRRANFRGDRPIALGFQRLLVHLLGPGCGLRLSLFICIHGGAVLAACVVALTHAL